MIMPVHGFYQLQPCLPMLCFVKAVRHFFIIQVREGIGNSLSGQIRLIGTDCAGRNPFPLIVSRLAPPPSMGKPVHQIHYIGFPRIQHLRFWIIVIAEIEINHIMNGIVAVQYPVYLHLYRSCRHTVLIRLRLQNRNTGKPRRLLGDFIRRIVRQEVWPALRP